MNKKKPVIKRSLKVGLFLLIFAALNFLFAWIYESVIMSTSNIVLTTNWMLNQLKKGKAEILVLGDSHPGSAINPIYFNRPLVTWTSAGEKYHHNYYKLKYFLNNFWRPKVVILPLDLYSFNSNFSPEGDEFFWVKYIDYQEFGKHQNQTAKYFHKYLKGYFFPYAGESSTIYQWLLRNHIDIAKAGFYTPFLTGNNKKNDKKKIKFHKKKQSKKIQSKVLGPGKNINMAHSRPLNNLNSQAALSERQKAAKDRVLNQFYKRKYIDPQKAQYFNKIMALCRENNIRLLLVKFPMTFEYCRYVSEHFFPLDSYYKKVQAIIPKNSAEFHILDYQDLFFNSPGLMKDPDHVSSDGQKIVSQKINIEIERLLYIPK